MNPPREMIIGIAKWFIEYGYKIIVFFVEIKHTYVHKLYDIRHNYTHS